MRLSVRVALFGVVSKAGKTWRVDQTNNCYIFPGMGLGLIAVKARTITDNMFMQAAKALAECSPTRLDPDANLLPPLSEIRKVSLQVALAVAREAITSGLATQSSISLDQLEDYLKNYMWQPEYLPYKKM